MRYPGKLCDGVEIKHRGYILLEPSTFEGGSYRFDTDDAPAPAPRWLSAGQERASMQRDPRPARTAMPSFGPDTGDAASAGEVEELLSWIDPDADGYDAWTEVLQALHHLFRRE